MIKKEHTSSNFFWLCFCLLLLIFSMGVSWQIHKSSHFFYEFWYSQLNIEETIKTYSPQNNHGKEDFASTNKKQHLLSFNEIVKNIHDHGKDLNQLFYLNNHQQKRLLLTTPEILHLEDVSKLIHHLRFILVTNFLLLLLVSSIIFKKKYRKPKRKEQYIAIIIPISIVVLSFSILGFTNIFYYLHTVVFPDNHQWFFYYQDSLMSSLMKAPDLFAAIGFTLATITLMIFIFLYRLLAKIIFKH